MVWPDIVINNSMLDKILVLAALDLAAHINTPRIAGLVFPHHL
jgi:hypothetical protein